MDKLKAYYQLTKPGVLYGNVFTAVAGFFLAAAGRVDWWLFLATLVGMTLVVASACVINNFLDIDIDSKMTRTKQRPSVTHAVPGRAIVAYSIMLGLLGFIILALWTNWLVVAVGIIGWVTYVWIYGAWSKRQSIHGTLIGAISGAMPVVGGYVAVTGRIDIGAVLVFLIMFFWQFPEFYSIAIYRKDEYAAAHVPVMTVVKGVRSTAIQIYVYTVLYVLATLGLTFAGYTGLVYFAVMLIVGAQWIWVAMSGMRSGPHEAWARRMFKLSMINVLVLCVMLGIGPLLP